MRIVEQSEMYDYVPTLNNLHPNEYSQEFHYYPFAVKLDRRVGSCNTPNGWCKSIENINKAYIMPM